MQTKTDDNQHIGKKIGHILNMKGIKQETLARNIGITQGTLSKLLRDEKMDEKKLQEIADALGMSIEEIKSFSEERGTIYHIENNHYSFVLNSEGTFNQTNNFDTHEKVPDVYEENKKLYKELLDCERRKNELLEELLKKKKEGE